MIDYQTFCAIHDHHTQRANCAPGATRTKQTSREGSLKKWRFALRRTRAGGESTGGFRPQAVTHSVFGGSPLSSAFQTPVIRFAS